MTPEELNASGLALALQLTTAALHAVRGDIAALETLTAGLDAEVVSVEEELPRLRATLAAEGQIIGVLLTKIAELTGEDLMDLWRAIATPLGGTV